MNSKKFFFEKLKIIDITYDYCYYLDSHKWDNLINLFTDDAELIIDKKISGKEDIKNSLVTLHNNLKTQHSVSNHKIKFLSNKEAFCYSYLQANHFKDSAHNSKSFLMIASYGDFFIKTKNGWKITKKHLTMHHTLGDVSIFTE